MTRLIVLFAATTCLTGCKRDVIESSLPQETENSQFEENANSSTPDQHSATSIVHESPEAVFAAFQRASAAGDLSAAMKCMDADSQKMMAAMISLPLALMAIDPEERGSIEQLMSAHGVSLKDSKGEFPIETEQGRIAFVSDVQEWMEKNADSFESQGKGPLRRMAETSLGEITVEGNSAHASITTANNPSEKIEFKRIDTQWYIHLGEPKITGSAGMGELNSPTFESSEFETFEEEGEESPTALVEAVTRDEYETAWQVTLDVTDQPAAEQLAKLAEELRLKLRVDAQFEKALQKPVSFKVTDGSRLQAIEDICRQLELTPKYSPVAISLDSGGRKHPVTFVGPFLVAINEFKTVPQTATGQLSLKVFAAGLPPRLLASLNEGMQNPIDLETVTDQKQNNLQRQVTFNMGNMPSAAGVCHRDVIIDLKNLLRNVEKLSKLKGKISFKLPLQIELMKFNELEPGTKQTAAAATLELTDVGGGSVTFEYSGIGHDDVDLHAFDAGGKPLDSFGGGSFGSGDSGQISKSFQNAPDRIEARVVTQQEDLEYRFEFESVPVPNHDQMPKQLSELRFERDAPLAVKFDSITGEQNFRNVKLHVSNQSNKDAQSLSLSFRYLDKQGKELETKSKQHESGDIPAEQKREVEVMAFFMPDQTQTVEVALNSVEFSDASRWDAEE